MVENSGAITQPAILLCEQEILVESAWEVELGLS
jgi:hypothetical protein